jgi:ketosteroid isomerase-like protein
MQATLANGRPYDNDYCFIFELTDGRIRRVREYMDTHRSRLAVLG